MMEAALVADTGQPGPLIALSPLPTPASRPLRPKPPPPPTPKPAPNLSRSPSLPPPATPKTPCFNPPPNLPPPLSPTPASPTSPVLQNDASLTAIICTTSESNFTFDPLTNETAAMSLVDRLQQTDSIWRPKGLSREEVACILEEEQPGVFLVQCAEETALTLSVRTPDLQGPAVLSLTVRQQGAFLHLDGSFLLFENIIKLVSFYFVSRDVLPLSLRLPQAITTATKREELEVIAAAGKDFWTSEQHQQSKKDCSGEEQSGIYLHLNPVIVLENPITRDKPEASTSKPEDTAFQNVTSPPPLHNGEAPEKVNAEPKVQNKPHVEMKYKRPPPRPPSVSGGAGLLFAAPLQTAGKRDESKLENDKKSMPIMSAPSRPPIPRASLRSSRKSSDREKAERMEDEKEGGEQCERIGPMESGCQQQQEETGKDASEDKQKSSLSAKKPSRPVPPPRRKPQSTESAACPNQAGAGGGGLGRSHPPAGRRPDVSLYSPQGGAVLVTDPDSASTSSTEDEVETQEQSRCAESRSPKAGVKRTPTTVILDRARHRLSTVLTGLISHDRRLTQRIVELARDPSSYFGNLVKEHRAFTLETMSRHSTSPELLQEIRQMMTQLKSYLLQSTELHSMMELQHQYAQEKLESIAEAALCKSVLKPLREHIYQCLEKLHRDNGSLEKLSLNQVLEKLSLNQSIVLGSTTTALGVTTSVPETSSMEKISIKLSNLHLEYSPQRKIEMLLKACKIIYDSMAVSSSGRAHGADDFLPVMMYVLARSNLSNLQLDVEYMMELMDPALTLGEGSYYLTTTYGALEHIKTFDQQRTATRQLSREVQDSIHRWERRRTLNKETPNQASVRDFLTVCCPIMGENPRTLGVLPTTTVEQFSEQCASRFEQEISEQGGSKDSDDLDSYILSVVIDDEQRPLGLTEVALSVKNSCQPGAYCFVYHPKDQPVAPPVQSGPKDPPPGPPPTSTTTVHSPSAPPNIPPPVSPSVRPPNVPPPKPTTTIAPPSSIPPISAQRSVPPPTRPPNVPPPMSTTTAGPPNTPPPLISPQRSAPSPVSPPIRPPNVPPPMPSMPAKTPPPTSQAPSFPPRSSAPNMPPPVPSSLLIPPKMLPPNLQQIPVTISVKTPASPASCPRNMPPPVPSPASVSSENTTENILSAQAITSPSGPLAAALLSDSPVPAESLPETPPVTGSTLEECTSLGEVVAPYPMEEGTEEDSLISL